MEIDEQACEVLARQLFNKAGEPSRIGWLMDNNFIIFIPKLSNKEQTNGRQEKETDLLSRRATNEDK